MEHMGLDARDVLEDQGAGNEFRGIDEDRGAGLLPQTQVELAQPIPVGLQGRLEVPAVEPGIELGKVA